MCQVNLDDQYLVQYSFFYTLSTSNYYVCHLYLVLSDIPFQMLKATKRHLSLSMGQVCNGPRLLWAKFVMG